jgi:hypothetical protein
MEECQGPNLGCSAKGKKKTLRVLVRKPEDKRLQGRLTHRWEYNIKMELREIDWGVMDWIHLA